MELEFAVKVKIRFNSRNKREKQQEKEAVVREKLSDITFPLKPFIIISRDLPPFLDLYQGTYLSYLYYIKSSYIHVLFATFPNIDIFQGYNWVKNKGSSQVPKTESGGWKFDIPSSFLRFMKMVGEEQMKLGDLVSNLEYIQDVE